MEDKVSLDEESNMSEYKQQTLHGIARHDHQRVPERKQIKRRRKKTAHTIILRL